MPNPGTAPAVAGPKRIDIIIKSPPVGASMEVKPGRFQISMGNNEQVEWFCASAASSGFTVEFDPNDCPFAQSKFVSPNAGPIPSGPIKGSLAPLGKNHFYKYKVTVGGNVLDPEGQVDP